MKAKTELILYQCLWMVDTMMRPTWRNMNGSFEEWSYRNGYLRQIQTLEAEGWLESREEVDGTERVYRLTRKGLLCALGGRHPEERWNRGWDGKWRMVMFDLPEEKRGLRNQLRKQLRAACFGGLQGSVWISPDPVHLIGEELKKTASACGVMTFFEGVTCCGESSPELVAAAWDFTKIHEGYEIYRAHLKGMPSPADEDFEHKLLEWGRLERELWSECVAGDPLLPRELWLEGYPGEKAWKERIPALRRAGKLACKARTDY
jgi:phenylacetic acid degradation operon negative regulatory protein